MNHLNVAIQAVLFKSEKPMSGYDISKVIGCRTGHSHQQIYRELKKLASRDDVLIEKVHQEDKPDKKLYSFANKSAFVTTEDVSSDLSKTPVAYTLLIRDILDGTDFYREYQEKMQSTESKFLEEIGYAIS